jgi:hypothetical protein
MRGEATKRRDVNRVSVAGLSLTDFPAIAAQFDYDRNAGVDPTRVRAASNKPLWWKCDVASDHVWHSAPNTRTPYGGGCPFCNGKRASITNSLQALFPELAKEFHPTRNHDLTPSMLVARGDRSVWWRCSLGHEWNAVVANRTRLGAGCPTCANDVRAAALRRPKPGMSLADARPDLAREWHPDKNNELTAWDVRPQSNDRRWWRCALGHEWETSPSQRTTKGTGCPYCSGRYALPETCLALAKPSLAAEWHPTKNSRSPADVLPGSSSFAWWLCVKGHEWRAKIANRSALGRACPYCTNQRVGYGNDLATCLPDLARQWHPTRNGDLTPSAITPGVQRKVWWLCVRGHEWEATVASRSGLGVGCPRCASGWQRSRNEIRLQAELEAALAPLRVVGSYRLPIESAVASLDIAMPEIRVAVEYDGAHWHAGAERRDRAKEARLQRAGWTLVRLRERPLEPLGAFDRTCAADDTPYVLAQRAMESLCEALASGSPWHRHIQECFVRYTSVGGAIALGRADDLLAEALANVSRERLSIPTPPSPERSLAALHPAIAAEWHSVRNRPYSPETVAAQSNFKMWWLCSACGREWEAGVSMRTRRGWANCPTCNRLKSRRLRTTKRLGGRDRNQLRVGIE